MFDVNPSSDILKKYLPQGAGLPQPEMTQGASAITGPAVSPQAPPMMGGMEIPPQIMQMLMSSLGGQSNGMPMGGGIQGPPIPNTMPMPQPQMGGPRPMPMMGGGMGRPMAPQIKPSGKSSGGMMKTFASGGKKQKKDKNRA